MPPVSRRRLLLYTLGAVSGALVVSARDVWYENLQRPAWVPSATSFLIVASVRLARMR